MERLSALSAPSVLVLVPSCWLFSSWPSAQAAEPLSRLDSLSVAPSNSCWCCCRTSWFATAVSGAVACRLKVMLPGSAGYRWDETLFVSLSASLSQSCCDCCCAFECSMAGGGAGPCDWHPTCSTMHLLRNPSSLLAGCCLYPDHLQLTSATAE